MKLIVPYANDKSDPEVHYCVRLGLDLLGIEAEWVRMNEPNDYALLINRLWAEDEKFAILEHDVIVWRGALEEVWHCEHEFCGFDGTLQCAKVVPTGDCPVNPRTVWFRVDGALHQHFRDIGIQYHDHVEHAPIINLNRHNVVRTPQ